MDNIKAYDDRQMKKSTKVVAVFACIGIIGVCIYAPSVYSISVAVLAIPALMLQKRMYVTETAIEISYKVLCFNYHSTWDFQEISDIHKEDAPDKRFYILHFMKDVMSIRMVFYKEDVDEIYRRASNRNPDIHIAEIN